MRTYKEIMNDVKQLLNNWANDETLADQGYTKEDLKREMLESIQFTIDSDFVIMTKEEFNKRIEHERNFYNY